MKIVVAMSGGVDSSVAAALLVEQGHEVIGLSMKTHNEAPKHNRACCTPDDMRDARLVADQLGIPFYVLNYAEVFHREIVKPFAESYARGETPNPCVECNYRVKFKPLLQRARLLGAEALATGHYARLENIENRPALLRGVDSGKDQSYFLFRLVPDQLKWLQFPLGAMEKSEVREHAERLGLDVATKRESQEICFVGAGGYAAVVEREMQTKPGPGSFMHVDGHEVGRHNGIHRYTVGQRRGLGIAAPESLYVVSIDAENAIVWVGPKPELYTQEITLRDVGWLAPKPSPDEVVTIQQRYREPPKSARIETTEDGAIRIRLVDAVGRGAPGQAAVIYRGDQVLGGGTIENRRRASLPLVAHQ